MDGRGYPDGLEEDAIPMARRIVAIAHAYLAMTEGRPHRAVKRPQAAPEELRSSAGVQLDPAVVEAMIAVSTELSAPSSG